MPHTRSQELAQQIYNQVAPLTDRNTDFRKDYGRICNRFPVLVLENGLAQAIGFLVGKSQAGDPDNATAMFLNHIAVVLGQPDDQALLPEVIDADLIHYLHLTRTALAGAIWFRRYAEGLLGVDPTGEIITGEDKTSD